MKADVLKKYPKVDGEEIQRLLEAEIEKNPCKIVVLDDDPTGVQTVHDISVYTDWSYDTIRRGFEEENKLFYILTNSRSFTREQTKKVHTEIGRHVAAVSRDTGKDYMIVSRSDSTLRGYYPLETEILRSMAEEDGSRTIDGEILCPYFKEGGRFTIDNIHYVQEGEELIPAGETEFARDKTFGYQSSDLRDYIEEKTEGAFKREDVIAVTMEEMRALDFQAIEEKLLSVNGFGKLIVNGADACDLKVFCVALYRAVGKGHHFLFRTAAGFVKELGGITDRPCLTRQEMAVDTRRGGLILIGSHTAKTTRQLERLKTLEEVAFVEFDSDLVLREPLFQEEIRRVLTLEEQLIGQGKTVAVYTKRKLLSLPGDTPEEALARSVKISDAVQMLAGQLKTAPSFLVAKGGITSSDIGTKALQVKKAVVLGQICPGIPVWKTGEESRFPGIPYIIFPGNVGEDDTLKKAVEVLIKS